MLTHGNILSNVEAALEVLPLDPEDLFFSFLPMSHVFERSMGHYAVLGVGASIFYARSLGTVIRDIADARPTIAMVVPRFLEKFQQRILEAFDQAKPPFRQIVKAALAVRLKAAKRKSRLQPVSLPLRALSGMALKAGLHRVREKLGGRLRFFVSGGAALSEKLWEFFDAAGVRVIQGYGLTETSPVISVNPLDRNKPGSVGLPVKNMSVRIAPDGEIEVSGPSVMQGYWHLPEQTRDTFTQDGWLKTGDIGRIDEEGYLYITDRKKDIIVSLSGKNIAPQNIENALCMDPLVEFACVLGEGKRHLGAILSPDVEALMARHPDLKAKEREPAELAKDQGVVLRYQEIVDRVNRTLPPHERIARFRLAERPFSREGGELTPTLKVRRRQVEKLHADTVEALFRTP
jgi:long-chain acyl-CoA synthetase